MSAAASAPRTSSIRNGCWCWSRRAASAGRCAGSPDRGEEFLRSTQGRDNRARARLALDADGRFLALDVETLADMGAYLSAAARALDQLGVDRDGRGLCRPRVFMDVRGVFTNTVPVDAYRGAGKPEANYIIERSSTSRHGAPAAIRSTLRRRNYARAPLSLGARHGDRGRGASPPMSTRRWRRPIRRASRRGARGGKARASCAASGSPATWKRREAGPAKPRACASGRRQGGARRGTQSNGQGHETSFPQIAADLLGLPIESFRLVQADTRRPCRAAAGTAGRARCIGRSGALQGDRGGDREGPPVAAQLLQCKPEALDLLRGGIQVADASDRRGVDLLVGSPRRLATLRPPGMESGLDCHVDDPLDLFTFPNGCHVAEVEVDPDTGAGRP